MTALSGTTKTRKYNQFLKIAFLKCSIITQRVIIYVVLFVVQMCELLHYFCDCELKQRIEAIVAFSDDFVSKLQYNQKFRYNELMQALNMSAAVTAKKTREFRSPPQEQVNLYKI